MRSHFQASFVSSFKKLVVIRGDYAGERQLRDLTIYRGNLVPPAKTLDHKAPETLASQLFLTVISDIEELPLRHKFVQLLNLLWILGVKLTNQILYQLGPRRQVGRGGEAGTREDYALLRAKALEKHGRWSWSHVNVDGRFSPDRAASPQG
jgi:hypothetical protein